MLIEKKISGLGEELKINFSYRQPISSSTPNSDCLKQPVENMKTQALFDIPAADNAF